MVSVASAFSAVVTFYCNREQRRPSGFSSDSSGLVSVKTALTFEDVVTTQQLSRLDKNGAQQRQSVAFVATTNVRISLTSRGNDVALIHLSAGRTTKQPTDARLACAKTWYGCMVVFSFSRSTLAQIAESRDWMNLKLRSCSPSAFSALQHVNAATVVAGAAMLIHTGQISAK